MAGAVSDLGTARENFIEERKVIGGVGALSITVDQLTIIAQPSIGSAFVMSDLLPSHSCALGRNTVTPVVDPLDYLQHPAVPHFQN